jgi:hypothetical protein
MGSDDTAERVRTYLNGIGGGREESKTILSPPPDAIRALAAAQAMDRTERASGPACPGCSGSVHPGDEWKRDAVGRVWHELCALMALSKI